MRLLNTRTFKLEHYHSHAEVDYAILSHTWQKDEVLFADIEAGSEHWSKIEGASKVKRAAATAAKHGFKYIWIDTCCIDKDSSAELSEAINSMFKWYQHSVICYAYLCDVKLNSEAPTSVDAEFEKSRWFTRAWTLQELIAPGKVSFYDQNWKPIGSRSSRASLIHNITKIDMAILGDHDTHMNLFGKILDYTVNDLVIYSIHTKMNWACGRQSTRKEDIAYSLMGIFDVNMPLLYGEGGARAFQRLQEQIIKHSDDQSILLLSCAHSPLAQRPDDFKSPVVFERSPAEGRHSLQLAKYSVDVSLLLYTSEARIDTPLAKRTIGILENTFEGDPTKLDRPAIALQKLDKEGQYSRDSTVPFYQVRHNEAGKLEMIGDPAEGKEYIIFTLDHSRLTREVVRLLLPFYRDRELSHDTILHRIFLPPINITTTSGKGAKYTKCCPDPQGGVISSSGIACDSSRLVACLVLQPDPADERFVAVIIYESAQRRLLPHLIDLQKWGEKQAIEPSMVHEIFDLASASKILQLDLYLRTMPFGTFANPWTEELKLVSIKRSSGCSIACRLVKKTVLESEVHHIEITIPAHTALRDQLG